MNGLATFITSPAFASIERASYPSFTVRILFPGCAYHIEVSKLYQKLAYPLGKTRRGFKKWLKRFLRGRSPFKCVGCGQDVMVGKKGRE